MTTLKRASQTGLGRSEERVSTIAVGTQCRWVNECAFGHREEHRERDFEDEVEDPEEEREELDEQRALCGVLGGVEDGEREVVEDVREKDVGLGFEQKAVDGVVLA